MNNDFEVHPIGTLTELRESRALAREIEQITIQFGPNILPQNVMQAYNRLRAHYQWQIETESV